MSLQLIQLLPEQWMGFSRTFLFLLVLCIEDTQNFTGPSLRNCKCVLATCVHLVPLYPLRMFLLFLFMVPVRTFPYLLSPYCLSQANFSFLCLVSQFVFLIHFNFISQAFWWYFSAFPTVFPGTLRQDLSVPSALYLHFFSEVILPFISLR